MAAGVFWPAAHAPMSQEAPSMPSHLHPPLPSPPAGLTQWEMAGSRSHCRDQAGFDRKAGATGWEGLTTSFHGDLRRLRLPEGMGWSDKEQEDWKGRKRNPEFPLIPLLGPGYWLQSPPLALRGRGHTHLHTGVFLKDCSWGLSQAEVMRMGTNPIWLSPCKNRTFEHRAAEHKENDMWWQDQGNASTSRGMPMIDNKLPDSPVVENPPSNAGHTGLIPGWGTKIPDVMEHLSPSTASTRALAFWNHN